MELTGVGASPQVGQTGAGAPPQVGLSGAGALPQVGLSGAGGPPQVGLSGAGALPQVGLAGAGAPPQEAILVPAVAASQGVDDAKDKRIKELEDQTKTLIEKLSEAEIKLIASEGNRVTIMQAMKKLVNEKHKVEDDYKEASGNLLTATRQITEVEETLKVTQEILKILETDHEEKEEVERKRRNQGQDPNYLIVVEENENDLVEDVDTGKLYPTKIAKILEVGPNSGNACKKCDKTVSDEEGMTSHMNGHRRVEKSKIKSDNCQFETHNGDVLLKHISENHVHFQKCLTCSRTFVNWEDLVEHVVKAHGFNNKNVCIVCSNVFNNVDELIHHIIRVHHTVNQETLMTTEAGHQLVNLWPQEKTNSIRCYDCGQEVGERSNLINHKREAHYKVKNCTSFHQHNYCRFSARDCIYIHRPEERHWQRPGQAGDGQAGDRQVQGTLGARRAGEQSLTVCANGPGCSWLANNRCKFMHEPRSMNSAAPPQVSNVNTVTSTPNVSTSSSDTLNNCMKVILDHLEQLEQRLPPMRNLTDFPPVEGAKKSQ